MGKLTLTKYIQVLYNVSEHTPLSSKPVKGKQNIIGYRHYISNNVSTFTHNLKKNARAVGGAA